MKYFKPFPPGHYYSPIVSIEEVKQRAEKVFGRDPKELQAIDLRTSVQLRILSTLRPYCITLPFSDYKEGAETRYYYKNSFYSYGDAAVLCSMIQYIKPTKIIEVGSGFSSCVIMDTNERYFNNSIRCSFIEPYPKLLFSLIKPADQKQIIVSQLQDINPGKFKRLQAGDILFIDSSHVSRFGSDVNYLFFEILPSLKSGVYVHFHDIFYPFEYPREWLYQGRRWNESYFLRAFLSFNNDFEIVFFSDYLSKHYPKRFFNAIPIAANNPGANFWMKKR